MIVTHRASILHRPVKAQSQSNVESLESQYEREQAYWKTKADKQTEVHERLMHSLYPMPEDKKAVFEQQQRVTAEGARAKDMARLQTEAQQEVFSRPGVSSTLHHERPWLATTQNYSQEEEEAARRRFAAEVAAENLRLMQAKQLGRNLAEDQERARVRAALTTENSWFNVGATSPRWLAPELRPASRPATAGPAAWAGANAPYACGNNTIAQQQQVSAQASKGSMPVREYPWSWAQ